MQISSQRNQQPIASTSLRPVGGQAPVKGKADAVPQPKVDSSDQVGTTDTASNLARLDGFAEALMERFMQAAGDAPEAELPAFREAAANLQSGLARLREGLADGSLQPGDVQRGVASIFQGAREVLDAGRPKSKGASDDVKSAADATKPADQDAAVKDAAVMDATLKKAVSTDAAAKGAVPKDTSADADAAVRPDAGADDQSLAEVVRGRFSGFADSVLARLESADMPDAKREAMALGVAEAFASATARLDAALFDPQTGAPIDRGTYQQLFSASLGALQEQLSFLFEQGGEDDSSGVVYGANKLAERLAPTGRGLDLAG